MKSRILCTSGALLIFVAMLTAILTRPPKWLSDFDQAAYLTIAYDIARHGVFSNGIFDNVNSTVTPPPPGMFFAPVYPWLIVLASKVDARFARALECSVEANHGMRDGAACEVYARPVHIMHAAFLTAGVTATAAAADLVFRASRVFWPAAAIATLALLPEADLFSFAMTESVVFSLYSVAVLLLMRALRSPRMASFLFAGVMFGLLCLTRMAFAVLLVVGVGIVLAHGFFIARRSTQNIVRSAVTLAVGWALIVSPWVVRNTLSVGKLALSEEYGSAALLERFAFNDMRASEFLLAFPYCVPGIGEPAVTWAVGSQAMQRFDYRHPSSFFSMGRAQRDQLRAAHGELDPLIGRLALDQMRQAGWRYALSTVALAWCGMWVGGIFALALVPLFATACAKVTGETRLLLLLYASPALVMLALHAAIANQYTRYNLILIAPFAAAAAWILKQTLRSWSAADRNGNFVGFLQRSRFF